MLCLPGLVRVLRNCSKVPRPWVWVILLNSDVKSTETNIVCCWGSSRLKYIMERKWLVSFIQEVIAWTNGWRWWSTKNIISVAEAIIETIGVPGLWLFEST